MPEIELVDMELGLDSVLRRESPLVPSVEGREDESVEPTPADRIDDVPLPIVLGRFIAPIVDPVVLPSGEIVLGLLPIDPVIALVEPRLDEVDPMLVDELSGDVVTVEPLVPTLPNVLPDRLPLPGGQLRPDVIDVVDPIGLVTPVGLVVGLVGLVWLAAGLVVDPVGLVADPVPVGLDGPMGPDAGPPTGPGGLVV